MKVIDSYVTLGRERDLTFSAEQLLRAMDEHGVAQAVVFPDDRERVVANSIGNRRIANETRRHPDRFIAGFTVNPWYGEEGIDTARTARENGALFLLIDPCVQGFLLNDPIADSLWLWAQESETPIHVRASPSASSNPSQLWFLARKYPKTRWILGGGGTTDYAYDLRVAARTAPDNLWFEISTMRDSGVLDLLNHAALEKVIFGSAAPRQELDFEFYRIMSLVPPEARDRVFAKNLEDILA